MEDKWETFNFCKKNNIPTPHTERFDRSKKKQDFPFFLKVASGTNAGRGVWHCKNDDDLEDALKQARNEVGESALLLAQKPTYGEVICAEVLYVHGFPVGFFFAKSVQADDLAGMGAAYTFSQCNEYKQLHSHEKVELLPDQWESVTKIFVQIGDATKYHGMIDIEFIIAGDNNGDRATPGSVWMLESNPRFSGEYSPTPSSSFALET